MLEFFRKLFSSDFMPHGHCYFWRPEIVWLHVISDGLIALSYVMIPIALTMLVRKRKDLAFNWMYAMFGVFILACGATHIMSIWNLWHATYRFEGVVKAIAAFASVPTAILMFRLLPVALSIPSPEQLRSEIAQRKKAEEDLRRLNLELEARVAERTAKLTRLNDALQRFAYIASHDLREPIRTVSTFNELLRRQYGPKIEGDGQQFIAYSVDACKRMHNLVTDLTAYVQAVDANTSPVRRVVNASELVDNAIQSVQGAISQAGAEVTHDPLPDIDVDAAQLGQVFQNLISNAIKYRRPGEPCKVRISATDSGDEWLFSVRDNGIGIENKYAEYVFQPFKRLHGNEYDGSGVGLTICKHVIEGHSGRIWFESIPGQGVNFFFTLPKISVAAAAYAG